MSESVSKCVGYLISKSVTCIGSASNMINWRYGDCLDISGSLRRSIRSMIIILLVIIITSK